MLRSANEKVLLIGDVDRQIGGPLALALPAARVTRCDTLFDGIAELTQSRFTAVIAAAEPMERRPEAAVRTLRDLAGDGRLLVFGEPLLEPLANKMKQFGCDDYLLTPAAPGELLQALRATPIRLSEPSGLDLSDGPLDEADLDGPDGAASATPSGSRTLLPASKQIGAIVLESLVQQPGDAVATAVRRIAELLPAPLRLEIVQTESRGEPDPTRSTSDTDSSDGSGQNAAAPKTNAPTTNAPTTNGPSANAQMTNAATTSAAHTAISGGNIAGSGFAPAAPVVTRGLDVDGACVSIRLTLGATRDKPRATAFLAELAPLLSHALNLQDRHNKFQKLIVTDELTKAYNRRYFRIFLSKIIDRAKQYRFPVTLFIFDIDNFKSYNDRYGHSVGDEILRETAALMRRCVRDHDLVARIGGDEFAVVFWEKEGPRHSLHADGGIPGRPPSEPQQILERFRRLLATKDFKGLGPGGQGSLTISGGLASLMWDGNDVDSLIEAADRKLMFGAKKAGKNVIQLVGDAPGAKQD
jgi:GGDEF domain-containing protein